MFAEIDTVLFDFDGTLIEVDIDFTRMRREIVALQPKYGIPINDKLYVLEMIDDSVGKLVEQDKQRAYAFEQEAHEIIVNIEMEAASEAQLLPNTKETFDALKQQGIKIGIVTRNCRRVVEYVLERTQLFYGVLLTRDDVEKIKPDPEHLLTALRLLDSEPRRALMVGDHSTDIIAGRNAQMKTAWLTRATQQMPQDIVPDFILSEIGELLPLFQGEKVI